MNEKIKFAVHAFLLVVVNYNYSYCQSDLPSDKKASSETVALYKNLKRLINQGIMFGHQDDLAYGVGWKYIASKSDVKEHAGDYPAVYGFELGRLELDQQNNLDGVSFSKRSYQRKII